MKEDLKKYMTIKEAARVAGVTPMTLWRWERKGILHVYRSEHRRPRIHEMHLKAALEGRKI